MLLSPLLSTYQGKVSSAPTPDLFVQERNLPKASLLVGDSREILRGLPADFFQWCVTSPPYWSLRDYGIEGQIGLEGQLQDYLESLVSVFREVRRTLRPDGTLWLNIGDSYTSGNRTWRAPDRKNQARAMSQRPATPAGLKPKDLIGVPWRLAFALQEDGWYLRSDVVWYKPNCQPESVKDRPTRSHEFLFLFSKSENYVYDHRAVRGVNDRQLRTVWEINARPYREAHFATYPLELVQEPIKLCTRPGDWVLDPFNGSGTTGEASLVAGRNYVGVELNPEYMDITVNRLSRRGVHFESD